MSCCYVIARQFKKVFTWLLGCFAMVLYVVCKGVLHDC